MIMAYNHPNIFHLSNGHYMVNEVTDAMISLMWTSMSRKQSEEFERVYGVENAREMFEKEIRHADHSAAFFCGQYLTCIMWGDWTEIGGLGRKRVLGCVCSDFAVKHTLNFVKHSKEVRDAFMLMEPCEVNEIYVFIADDFVQSKNWAVRVCGMKEVGDATFGTEKFKAYIHVRGEE